VLLALSLLVLLSSASNLLFKTYLIKKTPVLHGTKVKRLRGTTQLISTASNHEISLDITV